MNDNNMNFTLPRVNYTILSLLVQLLKNNYLKININCLDKL